MDDFTELLNEQMQDPDFRQAYEDMEPEYEIIRAVIEARRELNITQQELSERTGIQQSHISRLERGTYNPSLKYLKRIARGLGKELHITFK